MRKIIYLALALVMLFSCSITTHAASYNVNYGGIYCYIPKLPKIPDLTGSVELPEGAKQAAREAGKNAVKDLDIDFSKIKIDF